MLLIIYAYWRKTIIEITEAQAVTFRELGLEVNAEKK